MHQKRIVIVDEHPIILQGLSDQLSKSPHVEIAGVFTDANKAFFQIVEVIPDIVILDLELSGLGAVNLANQVVSRQLQTALVFFSKVGSDVFIDMALRLRVAGFILKHEPVQFVVDAIQRITQGETVYSEGIMDRMHFDRGTRTFKVKGQTLLANMTMRQLQVLRLLAHGDSVKEVSKAMSLSERAVESHKYRIMQKMGIHDRVVLTRYAIREGLVTP